MSNAEGFVANDNEALPVRLEPDTTTEISRAANLQSAICNLQFQRKLGMASPISASWNQLKGWLRAVDGLRRAA